MSELTKYDDWLSDGGAAALVIREPLEPVEGPDGVFFPSTFAAAEDKNKFAGGYNIDSYSDGTNICLVDSVGSQANRIEPIFAKPEYAGLVPGVTIQAGDKRINLLEAGHRAGDAIIRYSDLKDELQAAFKKVLTGNAEPLARIAPTSLLFGVWDSRDTQAKLPRLVSSTIRAFNVKKLLRSAQFIPAMEYVKEGVLTDPETLMDAKEKTKLEDAYSKWGLIHVPATGTPGGVQLTPTGSIRRDATLGLAALRRLSTDDEKSTQVLRRYIFGLALVALTAPQETYLRQGCNLVSANEGKSRTFEIVHPTGKRESCKLTHDDAKKYAEAAAKAFGVGKNRNVTFDKKLVEKDMKGEAVVAEKQTKKEKKAK